jgi:tRNA A22 N-methylase
MSRLGEQLRSFNASNYQLSVMPAEEVKVCEQGKPSILLAGVGDEQCITILKALMTQDLPETTHFIVSPATKTFYVRAFLAEMPINVLKDHVVCENKRCYEIIEFDLKSSAKSLSPFGTGWQENNLAHITHLKKVLSFYRAQRQNTEDSSPTDSIIDGYETILKKISKAP